MAHKSSTPSSYKLISRTSRCTPAARCGTFTDLIMDRLLFVATDRISAFDYMLATGIPHKGGCSHRFLLFWFEFLKDIVPNHLITADVSAISGGDPANMQISSGRSMQVKRADMFPVECVVRGYISGSAWKEYKATGRSAESSCRKG